MVDRNQIEAFAQEIARRYAPEKIILFGSQARGTATKDSDVDLLVIMDFSERRGARKAAEIASSINPRFPLDLLVRRPEDVRWRLEQHDFFMRDVMQEGIVLYEATH